MKNKIKKQKVCSCLMRCLLVYFFLLFSVFSFANIFPSKGQGVLQRKISMSVMNMMIEHILEKIEETDSIRFAYRANQLPVDRKVSLTIEDSPLEDVLGMLFDGNVTFEERGDLVIIKPANVDAVGIQVSGKVTDAETGEPIPGVNILVKGTTFGTATDADGNFSLDVEDTNAVLVFSFVGYVSKEVPLNTQSTLNVQLEADRKHLEEVVVVGYGTQKKVAVAAAISSVNIENIKAVTMGTVSEALQGKAAGVEVVNNSNSPGGDVSVRIRGVGSVSNSIQPLYVVDGMPVSGGISFLNNKDIAGIDILKDAAGAAIYGSRGATGVVLITTKSGKPNQKFSVEADASVGLQNAGHLIKTMGTDEYARLLDTFKANDGTGKQIPANMRSAPGTDWMAEILKKNAILQNHAVTVSGGSDRIVYSSSLNLFGQEGIARSSDYQRINYRLNTTVNITDRLKVTGNIIATSSKRHYINKEGDLYSSLFTSALTMDPYTPVYKSSADVAASPNSNEYSIYSAGLYTPNSANPVGIVNRTFQEDKNLNFLGNLFASYELFKGLTYKTGAGVEYNSLHASVFNPDYYESNNQANQVNNLSKTNGGLLHYYIENTLNFQHEIANDHGLSVLLGTTYEHYLNNSITGKASGFPGNDSRYRYLSYGTSGITNSENLDEWAILSYFMRATYSYKQKYFLTHTNRADGSSKFMEGKKWGVFPSVSAAWVVSEEGFFKNNIVTFLKIRAGWGKIGNQNIPMGSFLSTWRNDAKYNFGGSLTPAGYGILRPGNSAVTWETTRDANLGIEFDIINKISGTVDFYERKVSDLLLAIQPAAYTGLFNQGIDPIGVLTNTGMIRNRGIDLSLNYDDKAGKLGYNMGGVFSLVSNQVLDLGPLENLEAGLIRSVGGNAERTTKGQPVAQFYGFKTLGIFQNTAEVQNYTRNGHLIQPNAKPGDFKFATNPENTSGESLSDSDKQIIGNPLPKFTYGLNFGLRYGGFDLAAYFYGVYGNKVLESQRSLIANTNDRSNNLREGLLDQAWHGEGTSNSVPRIVTTGSDSNNFGRVSDAYIASGSYLRCRNINIGYEIKPMTAKISSMRIYAGIQNAFTITNYTGFDPAISNKNILQTGIDFGGYPISRAYLIGVNVKF